MSLLVAVYAGVGVGVRQSGRMGRSNGVRSRWLSLRLHPFHPSIPSGGLT